MEQLPKKKRTREKKRNHWSIASTRRVPKIQGSAYERLYLVLARRVPVIQAACPQPVDPNGATTRLRSSRTPTLAILKSENNENNAAQDLTGCVFVYALADYFL